MLTVKGVSLFMVGKSYLLSFFRCAIRLGAGLFVVLVIVGITVTLYPLTEGNFAGHVMTWLMAGIVGFLIARCPVREEEDWARCLIESFPYKKRTNHHLTFPEAMVTKRSEKPHLIHHAITASDCLAFAREHPVCSMATLEGDQPRVRTVLLWQAESSGLYFVLASPKGVCKQLESNPKAEVCFYNNPRHLEDAVQMRVSGVMHLLSDEDLENRASKEFSFWNRLAGRPVHECIKVYQMASCDTHFWTMHDFLKEPELHHIAI